MPLVTLGAIVTLFLITSAIAQKRADPFAEGKERIRSMITRQLGVAAPATPPVVKTASMAIAVSD